MTYPSAPLFLLYNPALVKGMMEPIFYFSESGRWNKPFAAHDVGTYPLANGQTYPEDMPVEECGNMLILAAAIAQAEGNADYAARHWQPLTDVGRVPAARRIRSGQSVVHRRFRRPPGAQRQPVDQGDPRPGQLRQAGRHARAQGRSSASTWTWPRSWPANWTEAAADGDHTSLTFDRKDTWSQKYNLVWDDLLGLNLFPPEIAQREIAFYLTKQNDFGLPLDSRKTYTKSDWILWTASMARTRRRLSGADPSGLSLRQRRRRVACRLSDWHETTNGKVVGFRARSVVGGYFMKMLVDHWRRQGEPAAR